MSYRMIGMLLAGFASLIVFASPDGAISPNGTRFGKASPSKYRVWQISPDIVDGMTGPQQLTNAFTQASSYEMIVVQPGVYDFTGLAMRVDTYEGWTDLRGHQPLEYQKSGSGGGCRPLVRPCGGYHGQVG